MRQITTVLLGFLFINSIAFSQQIVSTTYVGSKTKAEISNLFNMPFFLCGADYYKITYTSFDAKGQVDTLSGLLVRPDVADATYPILMYEHGTSSCKTCVPSRYGQTSGGDEGQVGLLFAGMGFVSLLPDYVGMGDGRGFQTYVHDTTIITANKDLLDAFRLWAPDNGVHINNQLFITGYSQGGYASMAFHKYMQETYGANSVTAAAHNSGPYSLSGVMRDLILTDSVYMYPAYIPNTLLGMNEVYEVFSSVDEVFKTPFVSDIQMYYDGGISLTVLNSRLFDTLIATTGGAIAHDMIKNSVLSGIENDSDYIINKILRYNDVYNWVPESPTRIFYCKADDQVPYLNSIVAIDTMYANGADTDMVKAVDVGSTFNHTDCVTPAFTQTIFFFGGLMDTDLGMPTFETSTLKIYPNPVNNRLYIKGDNIKDLKLSVWNMEGKKMIVHQPVQSKEGVDVSGLENGMYIVRFETKNGDVKYQKVIVQN